MVASVVDKQNFLHKKFDFWRAVRRVKPVDSEVLLINLNRIDLNMKEQKLWVELGEYPGREKQRKTQVTKTKYSKKNNLSGWDNVQMSRSPQWIFSPKR